MTVNPAIKLEILQRLHAELQEAVARIISQAIPREEKAKAVNALVAIARAKISAQVRSEGAADRQILGVILQYCCSVASLEYRHMVWPYEYMAFSRRVGELWEQFCKAAWDHPSTVGVARIDPPQFSDVRAVLLNRINRNVDGHANSAEILDDVATLFDIIGDINMKEDEVFSVNNVPHVIDFKSGFGSNEKGNMLRLKTVGQAYKIWNNDTKLLLLVRQDENNNYLNVLKRMELWSVFTGADAYEQIRVLTGADMNWVRDNIVDWEADLSQPFIDFLRGQAGDLTGYLKW